MINQERRDLSLVKRNVHKMVDMGASEYEVDTYIGTEGYTVAEIAAHKDYKIKAPKPTQAESAARGAAQGATFGFADEIQGAVGGAAAKLLRPDLFEGQGIGDVYKQARDIQRGRNQEAKEANPKTFIGAEIGGGIANPLTRLPFARGNSVKDVAVGGAGLGAIYGAGNTEDVTNLLQTTKDIASNAALGAGGALAGKAVMSLVSPISNTAKKVGASIGARVPNPIRNKLSKVQATNEIKAQLKKEGVNSQKALERMEKEGLDLIDIIDPRFELSGKGIKALKTTDTIKIADDSAKRASRNADKLKDEVFNLISKNVVSAEKGGEILGRNSKKIVEKVLQNRRDKAEPLYRAGLAKGTKIPLNKQIDDSGNTVKDLLSSPVVKKAIDEARQKSQEFAGTKGEKFYGRIFAKKDGGYIIPDNDVRVLHAVDHALSDAAGEVGQMGANKGQAAFISVKKTVSDLLDNASPELKRARKLYKDDSTALQQLTRTRVGKFAKMYDEGKTEDLAKASLDILKMPPAALRRARAAMPGQFDDLVRASLENRLAGVSTKVNAFTGNEALMSPNSFRRALFGKDQASLREALGNDSFNGLKKVAEKLDYATKRQSISRNARVPSVRAMQVPTGKYTAINRAVEVGTDFILDDPRKEKKLVELLFTQEGKQALAQIAKSEGRVKNEAIDNFIIRLSSMTALNQDG